MVDDHALFREGRERLLTETPDFAVIQRGPSFEEALEILAVKPVNVALLNLNPGVERGSAFFAAAREHGFQGRLLIVAATVHGAEAFKWVRQGASGVFHDHCLHGVPKKDGQAGRPAAWLMSPFGLRFPASETSIMGRRWRVASSWSAHARLSLLPRSFFGSG